MVNGRDFVIPEDVKRLAGPVLSHRIVMKTARLLRGDVTPEHRFIQRIVSEIPVSAVTKPMGAPFLRRQIVPHIGLIANVSFIRSCAIDPGGDVVKPAVRFAAASCGCVSSPESEN